ncbi:hypothetical protein BDZ97DRAFT_1880339 [Flammula alnicola]|nr:hypothetical protein BDZ97DRAFT_1880339 [Flammula alnicola]
MLTLLRKAHSRLPTLSPRLRLISEHRNARVITTTTARYAAKKDTTVKTLVHRVEDHIHSHPKHVARYIFTEMNRVLPDTSPSAVYEGVLDVLIRHKRLEEAATVVQRMQKEGIFTSNVTDAKMIVMSLSLELPPDVPAQDLIVRLAMIVKEPEYTEKNLVDLLKIMDSFKTERTFIGLIVESFRESRGEEYTPRVELVPAFVEAAARAGDPEKAFEMVERVPTTNTNKRKTSINIAYTGLLTALRDTEAWNNEHVGRVMRGLDERKLPPTVHIYNLLLSWTIRSEQWLSVMPLYEALQDTDAITPDAYTFGTLLDMYESFRYDPNNPRFVAPRRIYHDLEYAAGRKNSAMVPSTRLMNSALDAFMHQRDYAAAYVVVNSFAHLRVPLNSATYYAVVKRVVHRMWKDIAHLRKVREGQVKWGDRFLGVPFDKVELSPAVVNRILFLVSKDKCAVADPMYLVEGDGKEVVDVDVKENADKTKNESAGTDTVKYEMPSMEMMESVDPPKEPKSGYNPTPLKRLLRRAILADILVADGGSDMEAAVKGVSKTIVNAKAEMLPARGS